MSSAALRWFLVAGAVVVARGAGGALAVFLLAWVGIGLVMIVVTGVDGRRGVGS